MKNEVLIWKDDGLPMLESGDWTREKYLHLFNYLQMFSKGMRNIWDKRVYVDLYSGPGCCRIEGTGKVYRGSPLLALSVDYPFDKYVLCEKDGANLSALIQRISTLRIRAEIEYVDGDCDQKVETIISKIPQYSHKSKVLTFCFVDPFDLSVRFDTLRRLADSRRIDFLMLLALAMDANRNVKHYVSARNNKIDLFLDSHDWRDRWESYKLKDDSFQRFLAREFEEKMLAIGYLKSHNNTKEFKIQEKNVTLYHLAFFSKSERGYDFWEKGVRSSDPQGMLDFED